MSADHHGSDAQTTPLGARTLCPQCGAQLDSLTTTCGACGAVVTGGALDTQRMERVRSRLQEGIGTGYVLGDMLGRGGMGMVFQAREIALDRDVALKVLAFDPILNPDAYMRFEREARLAARLDHPNIVPIFAVGQGNGIAFYTMRMVRGGSVESLLAGGTPLAHDRATSILRDVASALDYAHAQGVVHRDIKPANVLLGESGHALVADFGIARAFSGPAASGTTGTGTGVIGSPAYMSPEQWRGEKVDGRADQYALGVLAYELFAGTRPFAGDSMQELLRMHLQEEPPDIVSARSDLPSHLTDAIRRAMAKDPADRFTSAGAFVAALAGATAAPAPDAATGAAHAPPHMSSPTVRTPVPSMPPGGAPRSPGGAPRSPGAGPAGRPAPSPRVSAAPQAAVAERRSVLPWLTLLVIAGVGGGVIWKLSPGRESAASSRPDSAAAVPAAAPAPNLDSIGTVERRMQAELDSARRAALAAERRADSVTAASRAGGAAPGEKPHAHLYVFAEGGAPKVIVDGQPQAGVTPALLQVSPGTHRVAVRGFVGFAPAETTVTLAAEDTETVVFRAERGAGKRAAARGNLTDSGAGAPSGPRHEYLTQDPVTGKPVINWPAVVTKLGFDPRTANPRALTPPQRVKYRRFQATLDSLRRTALQRP
ncbi:MAG TPA: protein kinase [Gemmatimonadaceae bacterium]|nr:protein kinase [Gemmatimonadaceae bacterium]